MDEQDEEGSAAFSAEVGARLRAVRRSRRWSLEEVERLSGGQWSSSAIGAYERGFRTMSLPRLRELAEFYDVPMSVLLGEQPEHHALRPPKVVLDLEALGAAEDGQPIVRYLRSIIVERGDFNGKVLSIRRDDVRALCAILHTDESALFERLQAWGALLAGGPLPADGEDEDEEEEYRAIDERGAPS